MERLYIIQGERGLFKAGKTSYFPGRLVRLRGEFRERGDEVARHHAFAQIQTAHAAELEFLNRLAALGHERRGGREWFANLDFDVALAIGQECTALFAETSASVPITPAERHSLADQCGINDAYLYQCLSGRRDMGPAEARRLESATAGRLRRQDLCQKTWRAIWPELADA